MWLLRASLWEGSFCDHLICSMHGIFTYIYHKFRSNKGKYYMEHLGYGMKLKEIDMNPKDHQRTFNGRVRILREGHENELPGHD